MESLGAERGSSAAPYALSVPHFAYASTANRMLQYRTSLCRTLCQYRTSRLSVPHLAYVSTELRCAIR
eukprot:3667715-Rhodomonas_salina.1